MRKSCNDHYRNRLGPDILWKTLTQECTQIKFRLKISRSWPIYVMANSQFSVHFSVIRAPSRWGSRQAPVHFSVKAFHAQIHHQRLSWRRQPSTTESRLSSPSAQLTQLPSRPHHDAALLPMTAGELVFPGEKPHKRLNTAFQNMFKTAGGQQALRAGGNVASDIAAHSPRKGSVTHTGSGGPAAPNPYPICLRAGWSVGTIQNIYMKMAAGADRYVGRTVAGLDATTARFAVLPPHFVGDADRCVGSGGEDLPPSPQERPRQHARCLAALPRLRRVARPLRRVPPHEPPRDVAGIQHIAVHRGRLA
jgi:hypothetical protein